MTGSIPLNTGFNQQSPTPRDGDSGIVIPEVRKQIGSIFNNGLRDPLTEAVLQGISGVGWKHSSNTWAIISNDAVHRLVPEGGGGCFPGPGWKYQDRDKSFLLPFFLWFHCCSPRHYGSFPNRWQPRVSRVTTLILPVTGVLPMKKS